MPENDTIRVLVADDNASLLRRYVMILQKQPDIQLVATASSGYEAVLLAGLHKPDVILMDIEMEGRESGILASSQIMAQLPSTRIVILTVYEDDESVFNAFKAGVTDYVLKNAPVEEIVKSIRDAYQGASPIRPAVAGKIRREFRQMKKREDSYLYYMNWLNELSDSEMSILLLLAEGKSRRQICALRQVELSTVKTQIRHILQKLQFSSVQEAVDMIRDHNLLDFLRQAHQVKQRNRDISME